MIKYEDNLAARLNGNNLQPLAGASVAVTDNANGLPAALYSDDGVTPLPQPLTTDNNGYFSFYAADGKYTLTISGVRFATFTRQVVLDDPAENPNVTVQELALPSGAGKVGFKQAGEGAVARPVQDKLRDVVSVKDFGAKGDGITDDSDAIERADTASPFGYELEFEAGKTYLVTRTVKVKKASKINLNGATIKASTAVTDAALMYGERLGLYSSITPFSVAQNTTSVTLPTGVDAPLGSLIGFSSNTLRLAGSTYKHGMWGIVTSVSGSNITISTPFYDSFQVDSIEVWRGFPKMEVTGGTFDLTAIPAVGNFSEGLLVRGTNVHVKGVRCFGSDNAGTGIRTDGENALVENCAAYGFLNAPGDGGGGKIGYGIAVYGNNSLVRRSAAYRCKHGLTSAARSKVAINVAYEDCTVTEDPTFVSGKYSGSIDFHYNVAGVAEVRNCSVTGQFRLLSIRCPAKVIGGTYVQTVGGEMVGTSDAALRDLSILGIKYKLASSGSAFIAVTSTSDAVATSLSNIKIEDNEALPGSLGRIIDVQRATALTAITIRRNKHLGGSLLRTAGGNIAGVDVSGNEATVTESAVRFSMVGGSYTITDYSANRNKITRAGSSNEAVIQMLGTTSLLSVDRLSVSYNDIIHSGDSGSGYTIAAQLLNATSVDISRNKIIRANFRAMQIDGCTLTNALMHGNVTDEGIYIRNSQGPSTLTKFSFIGNVGKTYEVAASTKTNYVDAANNFTTYTP